MEAIKRVRDRIQELLERLLDFGDRLHQQAREESDEFNSAQHRKDAELVSEARKEIWEQTNAMNVHSVDNSVRAAERANLNSTQITEHSKLLPWLMFTAILSGIALTCSVMNSYSMERQMVEVKQELLRSERESRVLQQQVMDQSAVMLREGIRQPDDFTNGPAGNLNYKRKEK